MFGLGAEISYHHFTDKNLQGMGAFLQWQAMNFQYHRFCGGMQATGNLLTVPVGMELGATYETPGGGHAATTSVHFAPFVSLGFATASLRLTAPILGGTNDLPRHGFDVGLALTLKLPKRLESSTPPRVGPRRTSKPAPSGALTHPPFII